MNNENRRTAMIRFGGLAFALTMLWAWFRPIGYEWNEHAGRVLDGMLALATIILAAVQVWRYRRDVRQGDGDAR